MAKSLERPKDRKAFPIDAAFETKGGCC